MTATTPLLAVDAARYRRVTTTSGLPELRSRSPGAAPWERRPDDESPATDDAEPLGQSHRRVTVADLIAKVTGAPRQDEPAPSATGCRHRARPTRPEPPADGGSTLDDAATEVMPARARATLPTCRPCRGSREPPSQSTGGRRDATRTAAKPKPHRSRTPPMIVGRVAAAAASRCCALALTGGAWQWQSSKNNMLNKVSALDPDSRDILDPNAQFGDENFLIVGVDSRFGAEQRHGRGHHRGRRRARGRTP